MNKRSNMLHVSETKRQIIEEIHRPARLNFKRRRTIVKGLDDLWQADLIEFQDLAKENKGFRYALIVIDCFSKFVWSSPLKSKSADDVTNAMSNILQGDRKPNLLQTDKGKEFYNAKFQSLMKRFNIKHYSTFSSKKAAIVERVIRTLKEKLEVQFHLYGSHKWIDLLPKVIDSYHRTRHSSINMKPMCVVKENEDSVLKSSFSHVKILDKQKFQVGDVVRISKAKALFEKGYSARWSTELFKVAKVKYTNPTTYLLVDMENNPISGAFYSDELQKTLHPDIYLVEKVLRKKGKKMFVKWLGLDSKFNSWLDISDIK